MLDPYYKQTIFHYFEMRKQNKVSTVQATNRIYAKFQKYIAKCGGRYYKISHKGGDSYLVDSDDEVIRSELLLSTEHSVLRIDF